MFGHQVGVWHHVGAAIVDIKDILWLEKRYQILKILYLFSNIIAKAQTHATELF